MHGKCLQVNNDRKSTIDINAKEIVSATCTKKARLVESFNVCS